MPIDLQRVDAQAGRCVFAKPGAVMTGCRAIPPK